MNNISDIVNPDWKADNYRLAKDMVDFGMTLFYGMSERNEEIAKVYRMYHGDYTPKEKTALTTVHGSISATPLNTFRISKVKIDQLLGESLEVGFSIEVDTISPVEKQKKKEEELKAKGRSMAKPIIQAMQRQGHNIYDGVEIPDFTADMKFDAAEFRTRNELISQRIANEKIKDALLRNIYYYCFSSNVFASEIFTKNVIDRNGHTSVQHIANEQMIFPITSFDQFNETAPILGHWEQMTFADIIREYNIEKDSPKYKEITQIFGGSLSSSGNLVSEEIRGVYNSNVIKPLNSSQMTASVFKFQWRYYEDKFVKKNIDGSIEYLKKKEEKDSVLALRFERLYQGATINGQVYLGFQDVKDYAITRDANGRVRALYDYTCTLVKTFGGKRTSFAKVLLDLSEQYDYTRWLLFREIRKSKGNAAYINRAFMGEVQKHKILYDLEDSGLIEYDSKERYDETGESITNGSQVIGAVNAGGSSNLIRDLISICMDIERVIDVVTGMNNSRKGTEQATATATTAQNNLQASRSVTYDLFYFTENHMQRAFTHLIQKTKSALYSGSQEMYAYLPSEDIAYLEESPEYFTDNFQARIVGGRRSQQIFSEISDAIRTEISAGKRSTLDFAELKMSESLNEAVELLRISDAKLQSLTQQSQQSDQQTKLQLNEQSNQANKENREDEQAAKQQLQDSINQTTSQGNTLKAQVDLMKIRVTPPSVPGNKSKK